MKLWMLKPIKQEKPPWEPWYNKVFGFLTAAEDETEARIIATENSGDETSESNLGKKTPG